jgi:xanthine dehydrogenase accessory factor
MFVNPTQSHNTIGGGHLEWQAIQKAREVLSGGKHTEALLHQRFVLGPQLGQCCGGVVYLSFILLSTPRAVETQTKRLQDQYSEKARTLTIFGAGHVAQAILQVAKQLPFRLYCIDSRENMLHEASQILEDQTSATTNIDSWSQPIVFEHSNLLEDSRYTINHMPEHGDTLVMTHNHAEDLEIIASCLERYKNHNDMGYIGLIGSKSKWMRFRSRLRQRGFTDLDLDQVTCPIGIPNIRSKTPQAIAVGVVAQLLQDR